MGPQNSILDILRSEDIQAIFRKNHVNRAFLVGSFARGEETASSDVDIIFEKPENEVFTLFNLGGMKYYLEEKLNRKVDLISSSKIHPLFVE